MALGRYTDLSLQEARLKRDEAREQLAEGIDPLAVRLQAKIEAELAARTTLRVVVDEFIEKMEREGKAPPTPKKTRWLDAAGCRPAEEPGDMFQRVSWCLDPSPLSRLGERRPRSDRTAMTPVLQAIAQVVTAHDDLS